jgi:ribosomal protein S27E
MLKPVRKLLRAFGRLPAPQLVEVICRYCRHRQLAASTQQKVMCQECGRGLVVGPDLKVGTKTRIV